MKEIKYFIREKSVTEVLGAVKMDNKRVCIYCMGDYGIETYFKLKECGIKVDFFADRNQEKRGYALEGLYCRSYEELLQEEKLDCIIIVAIKTPDELINSFKQIGFEQVFDKETAVKYLTNSAKKEKNPVSLKEPLHNIDEIAKMKKSIQSAFYYRCQDDNKMVQRIIADYFKRHA